MIPIRKAVRILLLNNEKELLLMCVEDFDISAPDGTKNKRFWCTIGGGIESDESIAQAALRELYEETGILPEDVKLGPAVWHSSIELILKGSLTIFDETFVVIKTTQKNVALYKPTQDEQAVVKELRWFSLDDIKQSKDLIFPEKLLHYLPDVLMEKYPVVPIELSLKRKGE